MFAPLFSGMQKKTKQHLMAVSDRNMTDPGQNNNVFVLEVLCKLLEKIVQCGVKNMSGFKLVNLPGSKGQTPFKRQHVFAFVALEQRTLLVTSRVSESRITNMKNSGFAGVLLA